MDRKQKNALLFVKTVIVALCVERLEYLKLSSPNVVASKIGCTTEELENFLYNNGNLNDQQLNKLAKLCNITLADIINTSAMMVSAEEKRVISRKNPGLNDEQKEDILDIKNLLSDITRK
jgi:hypothetical protein